MRLLTEGAGCKCHSFLASRGRPLLGRDRRRHADILPRACEVNVEPDQEPMERLGVGSDLSICLLYTSPSPRD